MKEIGGEGGIDSVLFAEPKRSTVDIVQAIGRALRTADSKKMAYIVVPVFVDEDDPEPEGLGKGQ